MNLALLRAEGTNETLGALRIALNRKVDRNWQIGETEADGTSHLASGFSVIIADVATPKELIAAIRSFLRNCRDVNLKFSSQSGLAGVLSIGTSVGATKQYTASLDFTPADLLLLSELGLGLEISAYPTSDEANTKN